MKRGACSRCNKEAPVNDDRYCASCYVVLHPNWCAHCGPAKNPDKLTNGHHRLFLVLSGTTWRFWWSLNAKMCHDQVRRIHGALNARFKVKRATGAHLQALRDVQAAGDRA